MKTVATKNPTKIPTSNGAIDLRLVIFRTPNSKTKHIENVTKKQYTLSHDAIYLRTAHFIQRTHI